MAISATTVLPEPTSPCSSRSMRCGAAMSSAISLSAWRCELVSAKGSASAIRSRMRPSPVIGRPRWLL
jgi:hypothetical protein